MSSNPNQAMTSPRPNAITQMKRLLGADLVRKRFADVLRDRAPQFMASIANLVQQSYQLQKCEPESILAAAFIAASLDLTIDKNLGHAWIVPYGKVAQFQIGYKGWIQFALRTNEYQGMNAVLVNAEALGGLDDIGDPIIYWDKIDETQDPVGYAFAWKLTSGFSKIVYWPMAKMEAHAERYSKAYQRDISEKKKDSPWSTDFDKMALKTIIANALKKWGKLSIEMRAALVHDQGAQRTMDAEVTYPDNGENGNGGDKPLTEEKPTEQIDEDQRRAVLTVAQQAGCPNDMLPIILQRLGFGGLFEITTDRYEETCEALRTWNVTPTEPTGQDSNGDESEPQETEPSGEVNEIRAKQQEQLEQLRVELMEFGYDDKRIGDVLEIATGVTKIGRIPDDKLANAVAQLQAEKVKAKKSAGKQKGR